MSDAERRRFAVPAGTLAESGEALEIGVDLIVPQRAASLLVCVPGGGMLRGYYDLQAGDGGYSFAAAMAAAGHAVAMLDPLGLGTSSHPADGFLLHPSVHARAIATASSTLAVELGLPAVGVGHSMGGMLVCLAQAEGEPPPFRALALLGAGPVGLDWAITDEERGYSHDPERFAAALEMLARKRYATGYHELSPAQNRAIIYGGKGESEAVAALKRVGAPMLAMAATYSLVPGGWAPQAAKIDVPLFLAVGELDMLSGHDLPRSFPAADDISLLMLPATGHTHFVFPTVERLFRRFQHWLQGVLATGSPEGVK